MIGYLETSAFVPLLITEPSSPSCRRFWDDADTIVASRLTYVEAAASLAQARRLDRLTIQGHHSALELLDRLWEQLEVVEVDQLAVVRAAALADQFGLRGYDAVHCAAAESVADDVVVAAAGDRELLAAWSRLGLATYDTNAS